MRTMYAIIAYQIINIILKMVKHQKFLLIDCVMSISLNSISLLISINSLPSTVHVILTHLTKMTLYTIN